jgi:hypothetical protein
MSALCTVNADLLEIKDQTLDQIYVDAWTERECNTDCDFDKIRKLALDTVQLSDKVSYCIFTSCVNVLDLNILNSRINSKTLYRVLRGVNPYSLRRLDLSGSVFDSFDETDLTWLNGLFSISELILPDNMDPHARTVLKTILRN